MRTPPWKRILLQSVLFSITFGIGEASPPAALNLADKSSYDLAGHLEILEDPTRRLTIHEVSHRDDWSGVIRQKVPNLGLTKSAVWIRFWLNNQRDTRQKYYVSFEYPVTDSVIFYAAGPGGRFQEQRAGDSVPASTQTVPDRHFIFPVAIGPHETVEAYLRIQSTAGMTIPLRILSDRALSLKAIRDYTLYGALFGFFSLVLIYFVAVGQRLCKSSSLWFATYSVFFALHTAGRGGFLPFVMPDGFFKINNLFALLVIGGLFFTGAKFFRVFLSLKDQPRPFDAIMVFFQYLSLPFVLFALFPNPFTQMISFLLLVINPLFSISLAFYFWRKGESNAGYFAFGWIVAHLFSVYDFFRIIKILPYSPLGEWPIPFSFFIALFFFSAALIRQNTTALLMARTDPLTGLANRRRFDEALESEWKRCLRQQLPLSLIMGDVDHFKDYNDTLGHRAGDRRLCHVAEIMKQHARRAGDTVARYGGEEFALLLPNIEARNALYLAEKIRRAVEDSLETKDTEIHDNDSTISFGISTIVPREGEKPECLVLAADSALYEAKRGGRNCAVLRSPSRV